MQEQQRKSWSSLRNSPTVDREGVQGAVDSHQNQKTRNTWLLGEGFLEEAEGCIFSVEWFHLLEELLEGALWVPTGEWSISDIFFQRILHHERCNSEGFNEN